MQDRDIVNDLMGGTKASINNYTMAIVETSNPQLRSTWQTLRNEAEQMHYQLFQMAEQKGYYMSAPQANQQDVQKIKSTLTQSLTQANTGSTNTSSHIYSSAGASNIDINNPAMTSSVSQGMTSLKTQGTSSTMGGMTSSTSQSMKNMTNNMGNTSQKKKNK